ncbi:hypothetical protein EMIHUDRAFT_449549 [Emiliania huxleyi CCMP1516]|nr:hypothetical protein EMIHUDRAFT_449549 [Emiliania huxleyi CCMP1516]EOD32173.1 hypothetical protein EMIHUDRAFT_449549 [Emiliania huxleyi CCMP1516]|eukprot:XP_005784602.1 hypothetical protein EMIHUDRAFT_449549 [Emiliania huxleyi CCMP1516]
MGGGGPLTPRTRDETAAVPTWVDCALGSACGLASACCAAPFILTVDRAVTENSAGKSGLGAALLKGLRQVFTRPHVMLTSLPYWMVAGVYGSTYATANSIDAVSERAFDPDAENKFVKGATKLFGVTVVNMCAGVAKDAAFARMFGAGGAKPPPVPPVTYMLFAGRDVLTIAAGFTASAANASQLLSPVGMQCLLTPVHLLALNMYNVPIATPAQRASQVGPLLPSSTLARMGRFGCAYGIGGIMNTRLTNAAREWAVRAYAPEN